jgi:hypothetical protein
LYGADVAIKKLKICSKEAIEDFDFEIEVLASLASGL